MTPSSTTVKTQPPPPQPLGICGWWRVAVRVVDKVQTHNAGLLAGGIAMYGLLSVFPGLAATVFIYGLFATPADVSRHMSVFAGILPPGVWSIFNTQLQKVATHDHSALTVAAVIGLLLALWGARLTMSALMTATTIAYEVPERRGLLLQILTSLLLTFGAIVGFLAMLLVGVVVPVSLYVLGTSWWVNLAVGVLRWLVLWGFAVIGLALVYHFAPARRPGRWRLLTCGSAVTASLWLAVSGLFAVYVRSFSSYDQTYGALAGVIVLLLWFYLLSYTVLLGAEVNAALSARRNAPRAQPSAAARTQGQSDVG